MSELGDECFVSADNFPPVILDAAAANAAEAANADDVASAAANAAEAADVAMYATAATHAAAYVAAYANARERQWQFAPSVLSY
jgi:hypothetical protein